MSITDKLAIIVIAFTIVILAMGVFIALTLIIMQELGLIDIL